MTRPVRVAPAPTAAPARAGGAGLPALVEYLRGMVLDPPGQCERCHAIFLDERLAYLGDDAFGTGGPGTLSVRMRDMFGGALRLGARGMLVAHNHPSGHCRPSGCDIAATRRLVAIGRALEIELIDHLIFTRKDIYSMRAGGHL